MVNPKNSIILEQASLELVPEKYWKHDSCRLVEERFGITPNLQLLDENYHRQLILKLGDQVKRGRPDVVHLALLDVTGTPAFIENSIDVYIHTLDNTVVKLLPGVRPPRTLQRFCGVMSKVLSGMDGAAEQHLFKVARNLTVTELAESIGSEEIVSLTSEGISTDLLAFVRRTCKDAESVTWIIGGFSRGHFSEEVKSISSDLISISKYSLAAHVVLARLCFGIEST